MSGIAESAVKMAEWVERRLCEDVTLADMAREVGYSPYHCSALFHKLTGTTFRSYLAKRRLARAAQELVSSERRVLDVAIEYGYSSQEAFTRAFAAEFGSTPAAFRKALRGAVDFTPSPLISEIRKRGELELEKCILKEASVRVEYIPEHMYLGVYREARERGIWPGHDCDFVTGLVTELSAKGCHPVVTGHTAGWVSQGGHREYFYGLGLPVGAAPGIPEGFELRGPFPGGYYLVFSHPVFNYPEQNGEVMARVEQLAWGFDPAERGYAWDEGARQIYQRHNPEGLGYQILRPVK